MEIKVQLNNLRIAPRKTRQVVDVVRNKDVKDARALLEFMIKGGSEPVLKLLNSAVASAVNDFKLEESSLYIYKITADEGPKLKRSFPMSRGRAYPILKRTSHIQIVLRSKKSAPKAGQKEEKEVVEEVAEKPKKLPRKKVVKKSTK